jgi:hypothetical protein
MFQIINSGGNHRLSSIFKLIDSKRRGNIIDMNKTNTEFGRQSLYFRGPVVWNNLDRNIRNSESLSTFKSALKKRSKLIKSITFAKGTCNNHNKNMDDFIYF